MPKFRPINIGGFTELGKRSHSRGCFELSKDVLRAGHRCKRGDGIGFMLGNSEVELLNVFVGDPLGVIRAHFDEIFM